MIDASTRHPSVRSLAQFFEHSHLHGEQKMLSQRCSILAEDMITSLPDNPELTAGLRKLLEAKDCFVRASLDAESVSYTDR